MSVLTSVCVLSHSRNLSTHQILYSSFVGPFFVKFGIFFFFSLSLCVCIIYLLFFFFNRINAMSPTPSSTNIPNSQHSSKHDEISSLSDIPSMNFSSFNLPTSPPSQSNTPLTQIEEVKICEKT